MAFVQVGDEELEVTIINKDHFKVVAHQVELVVKVSRITGVYEATINRSARALFRKRAVVAAAQYIFVDTDGELSRAILFHDVIQRLAPLAH